MNKKLILVVLFAAAMTYIAYENPFPSSYESQSAQEKQDFIWKRALADNGSFSTYPNWMGHLYLVTPLWLGGQDMNPVGHNESDQNPAGRKKEFHSVAKSAKFKFNFESNPFTGAFAEKECIGIMRSSSSTQPTPENTRPGFGAKIFRDGVPSGSFVAMWDLFGQDNDTNYFTNPLSNHVQVIPDFKMSQAWASLKILMSKFLAFTKHPNMVGLSDLAKYTNKGEKVANPKAPFEIVFKPNPAMTKMCHNVPLEGDAFGCLKDIAKGTLLYTIYYVDEPIEKKDAKASDLKLLGTMTSDSEFISSKFMDEIVQFKHVFWADEVKILNKQSWDDKITNSFSQEDGAPKWKAFLDAM